MITVTVLAASDHSDEPTKTTNRKHVKDGNEATLKTNVTIRNFLPGICILFLLFGINLGRKRGRFVRVVIGFFRLVAVGFIVNSGFFTMVILVYNLINKTEALFDNFYGLALLFGNISTGITYVCAYRNREVVSELMEDVLEFARQNYVVCNGLSYETAVHKLMRKCDCVGVFVYIGTVLAISTEFYIFILQSRTSIQLCYILAELFFGNRINCEEFDFVSMHSSVTAVITKSFEFLMIILFVCLSVAFTFAYDQICRSCLEVPPGKVKMNFAMEKHSAFCDIVNKANNIFSLILTTWCGSSLVGACLWIRAMKSEKFEGMIYLVYVCENVLTCIVVFLAISWSALQVNEKVDDYARLIESDDDARHITPSMKLHYIYTTEDMAATAADTRFTGMGFFTFSRSFIITACASVLTYSLVFYAIQ